MRSCATELRDTEVAETKTRLAGLMAGGLDAAERMLAAELISPLVVPNSSFSEELTAQERDRADAAVAADHRPDRPATRSSSATGRG